MLVSRKLATSSPCSLLPAPKHHATSRRSTVAPVAESMNAEVVSVSAKTKLPVSHIEASKRALDQLKEQQINR